MYTSTEKSYKQVKNDPNAMITV